jgi:cellulose synthase/poly-beta-1,6-N-acetylglucosamine synthase-like glycosyltransferase
VRCLSVVVPCYNESATILELLKSVLESPYVAEVIVVDDGSSDDRLSRARQAEQEERGVGRGQVEDQVEERLAVRGQQQHDEREECGGLHLPGQRGAEPLEGVPPRGLAVNPVECGPVRQGLRGVPAVGGRWCCCRGGSRVGPPGRAR